MNEIDIINNIRKIVKNKSSLNLRDDVFFDVKKNLLASIDTYNEKIHFPNFKNPDLIIKKVLRSSISDVISKGVNPKYVLMSFSGSKNHFRKSNINLILKSIQQEQKKYNFSLIGGDIAKSSKSSFTICVIGYSKKIIRRNSCSKNDDIYITGNIGDSSVGLSVLKNKLTINAILKKYFLNKYYKPDLPFGFHNEIKKFANSSMDISDGILLDLKKIIFKKKFNFIIDYNLLPRSINFKKLIYKYKVLEKNHLFNGDDYQILFTAKPKYRNAIIKYALKWNQKISRIGQITTKGSNYLRLHKKLIKIVDYQGYIHNFK